MAIPVKQAQAFAVANDLQQVIIFGHDEFGVTHVVTWGDTVERAAQAADGANYIKREWGWPDSNITLSASVTALIAERDELLARVKEMEVKFYHSPSNRLTVHVIEGTEFERGWGCRPDGYLAFLSEIEARNYITDYNRRFNDAASAPAVYTTYDYRGLSGCSYTFFQKVSDSKGGAHFNHKADLLK